MNRNLHFIEKIGKLIPGYSGYAKRDSQRNSDKILRESIAADLLKVEASLQERMENALENKEMGTLTSLEKLRKRINTFSSKVKYSSYGESAYFSDNQIKEEELDKIYQYDLQLAEAVANIKKDAVAQSVDSLTESLMDATDILESREDYIKQFN